MEGNMSSKAICHVSTAKRSGTGLGAPVVVYCGQTMSRGSAMFRRNQEHQQLPMFSTVSSLRDDQQKLLDGGWAGTFYRELFCRLDEQPFAVLYSDEASRPNVPVNVLVGLEVLKAGYGWSDAEMYEAFTFNLPGRYPLGYPDLSEAYLD